jgi:hypothetical protein
LRKVDVGEVGKPKVGERKVSIGGNEDIGWFDIAMDDTKVVQVGEGEGLKGKLV